MRERRGETGALPGERVELPLDRGALRLPAVLLGGAWLALLLYAAWPALAAGASGGLAAALDALPAAVPWLGLGGGLLVAALLRESARTAGTVFTTEGVWQPGWLGGGRFWRFAEVERAEWTPGRSGATHLELRSGGRRMRIRVAAFRRPGRIRELVQRYGVESGEVPSAERE